MDRVYGIDFPTAGGDYYVEKLGLMSSDAAASLMAEYNLQYYHSMGPSGDRIPGLGLAASESAASVIVDESPTAAVATASSVIKAKIASHPYYPKLLDAYIDCQKVGALPEIAVLLEEIKREKEDLLCRQQQDAGFEVDPQLDEFMETYCDVLVKYKSDLSRPYVEATSFLNNIETQLEDLCKDDGSLSFDGELSGGETEIQDAQMKSKDRELKDQLLQRYGSHIRSLKLEFSKKKKKGKLPKEAKQALLQWWNIHYNWPYPTEADKILLAELTGLDQKQINNWFINQRKRHWKPSEDMQIVIMGNISANDLQ